MQLNDKAISYPEEDRLDRKGFAHALAEGIFNIKSEDSSFVIGLTGGWGSGKTSVISLVRHYLHCEEIMRASDGQKFYEDSGEKLNLENVNYLIKLYNKIKTNPDWIRRLNCEELGRCLCPCELRQCCEPSENIKKIHRYMHLKSYVEKNPQIITIPFSPWMISGQSELTTAFLSEVGKAINSVLDVKTNEAFVAYAKAIIDLLQIATAGIDLSTGGGFSGILSAVKETGASLFKKELKKPTLDELRNDLICNLKKLKNTKLLIILDDLDRLTPDEAVKITSLVKSVGDLPNVVYLLSYDEKRLAKLINHALTVDGSEYLEKIIQYRKALPQLDAYDLERLFNSNIENIDGLQKQKRYRTAWNEIISENLKTPRDVLRLANNYNFSYKTMSEYTDPFDLLILEIMQLFHPQTYDFIRDEYHLLRYTDITSSDIREKNLSEKGLYALFSIPRKPENMPPRLQREMAQRSTTYSISNPQNLKHYFRLNSIQYSLSKSELQEIFSKASFREIFECAEQRLENLPDEGKGRILYYFIKYLEENYQDHNDKEDWFIAFSDYIKPFGKTYLYRDAEFPGANIERFLSIAEKLCDLNKPKKNRHLLESAINEVHDITFLCMFVRQVFGDAHKKGMERKYPKEFNEDESPFRQNLLKRIKTLHCYGGFWSQNSPQAILEFWWGCGQEQEVKQFTNEQFQNKDGIGGILKILEPLNGFNELPTLGHLFDFEFIKTNETHIRNYITDEKGIAIFNRTIGEYLKNMVPEK